MVQNSSKSHDGTLQTQVSKSHKKEAQFFAEQIKRDVNDPAKRNIGYLIQKNAKSPTFRNSLDKSRFSFKEWRNFRGYGAHTLPPGTSKSYTLPI